MSTEKSPKLNLDDLMVIFHDPERLQQEFGPKFKSNTVPGPPSSSLTACSFQMELPFDEIKTLVLEERDLIFSNLEDGATQPRFEHVGSTSIKGMPGMPAPDGLLLDKSFPPSRSTVKALLDSGWAFKSVAPHHPQDLWFMKALEKAPCKSISMVIHLMSVDNKIGLLLQMTRDRCNSDKNAFEDYKSAKIAAAHGEDNSFVAYKMNKGKCKFLVELKKELGIDDMGKHMKIE